MAPRSMRSGRKRTQRRCYLPMLELLEDRCVLDVTIGVDAAAGLHAINANVYGVAFGDATSLADLNAPFNRNGGNAATRYNWQQNADNKAFDYFFESIGDPSSTPGKRGDSFIAASKAASAQADLTIPMIDWVAKLGPNRDKLASFSVAKYGNQKATDRYFPDAGNGVLTNGQNVTGNNPNDANVPNSPQFEQGWVQHLVNQWGTADQGGLRYYALDNESSIWYSTHRDVQPTGATMQQIRDKMIAYASTIKSVDPSAQVLGPEEWGWGGYLYSGYDQQYAAAHNYSSFPDRAAHGNMDYLPWLLDQLHQHDASTGQRRLDVFTAHYYPQGGEFSSDVSTTMQLLRNRSTRSLWDPNYVDQSWINDKVDLIPRLKDWVNTYYPGTRIGLTEYNWGAENHMNGATAQADILGIVGREGIDLASRWTTPATGTPPYNAMKMYRNYDGNHSTFGDTSVSAGVPNPDQVAAFAALRSQDGALTVMVVNKNLYDPNNPSATTSVTVNLSNFVGNGTAQEWQLLAPNPADMTKSLIVQQSGVPFTGSSFQVTLPMQSVTLFVMQPAAIAQPAVMQFSAASYQVAENGGSAVVTVSRGGNTSGTVSVHYATSNGSAAAGIDYVTTSGTLVFQPGETSKSFTVPLLNDPNPDGNETIVVALDSPGSGAVLGTQTTTTVTIDDIAHPQSPPPPGNGCPQQRKKHHHGGGSGQKTCHVRHHHHPHRHTTHRQRHGA